MRLRNLVINTKDVVSNLRKIRKSKGLSLKQVEVLSNGIHKGAVIGSYERGNRSISVNKLIEIAKLYDVPVTEFFSPLTTPESWQMKTKQGRLTIKINTLIDILNVMKEDN